MTSKRRRLSGLVGVVFALSIVLSACSSAGSGGPASPGSYNVQPGSVHFDGERYDLLWADQSGALHEMQTRKLRLVQDPDHSYLEVPSSGDPILHLKQDEPITVEGQDRQGSFSSSWFPFLLGTALGSQFGGRGNTPIIINQPAPGERGSYAPSTPAYRYPPTDTFGRNEDLHGSVDSSKPQTPDYTKVQPQPYATSGKSSGTGGGTAASNKAPSGNSSGSGNQSGAAASAASGQSGGTGSGTAASDKGGFRSGDQSYSNKPSGSSSVGAGSSGSLKGGGSSGGTSGKPSTGVSGSKSTGGGGSSGSKGIGGGRVGGGRR